MYFKDCISPKFVVHIGRKVKGDGLENVVVTDVSEEDVEGVSVSDVVLDCFNGEDDDVNDDEALFDVVDHVLEEVEAANDAPPHP